MDRAVESCHHRIDISLPYSFHHALFINALKNFIHAKETAKLDSGPKKKRKGHYHDQAVCMQATHAVSTMNIRITSNQRQLFFKPRLYLVYSKSAQDYLSNSFYARTKDRGLLQIESRTEIGNMQDFSLMVCSNISRERAG